MARVVVDTAKLRRVAGDLRQMTNQLKSEAGKMKTSQQTLKAQWDGPSNDTFNAAFNRNVNEFEAFSNLILEYAQKLEKFADDYERMENQNKEIAKTR